MAKKIVLTGGGTAGHVMPNLALLPELMRNGWKIDYIGSYNGIERELVEKEQISYHSIATGKLRRYLSAENLADAFRVVKGLYDATKLLHRLKPDVVFSKGGFVSVPVVFGAWLNRIPVVLHESDLTPGLANKLSLPFATRICATFPETMPHLKASKATLTGNPIRRELLSGSREKGLAMCGFTSNKPVLAIMGGSLGSVVVNEAVRAILPQLLERYQTIHICGKGHLKDFHELTGYKQFEFVGQELPDLLAAADFCVSRAGSNFIFELLALKKPSLLIPLSKAASRGDQILNAASFKAQGFSEVLEEEKLTAETLMKSIDDLYNKRQCYIEKMNSDNLQNSITEIIKIIEEVAK